MIDLDSIGAPAFLVEVLPDGQFRYASVNAASRLRTGIGDELIPGRTPKECLEPALAVRVLEHYAECVERGGIVEYDEYAQFSAGSMGWRTWLVPIRQVDGRVTHLLGICSDLMLADRSRDLHDKNMQLSLALQALKGASWTYDGATGRYAASDAFALLMGEEMSRPVSWAEWCAPHSPERSSDGLLRSPDRGTSRRRRRSISVPEDRRGGALGPVPARGHKGWRPRDACAASSST